MSVTNHLPSSPFTLYPAIDLREGQVVRLQYGNPDLQTVFSNNPLAMARQWLEQGAQWLHLVNLDGAFGSAGKANWHALAQIALLPVKVQFGGGLRTANDVDRAFAVGVTRVILGTAAANNPEMVATLIARYGEERVVVALDAREDKVQTHGWQTSADLSPSDLGRQLYQLGCRTVLHTDIGRDGVLTGVNWQASQQLAQATGLHVIASGGVATYDDIVNCQQAAGIEGVILGRALYNGKLALRRAFALVNSPS